MKKPIFAIASALPFLALAVGTTVNAQTLPVPMLVEVEQARRGNPVAGYAALVELEKQYQQSSQFAAIYPEIRFMAEEFLGIPDAGLRAMSTVEQLRRTFPEGETPLSPGYVPESALRIIEREAARTQVVIFSEEHHLPQTRSLYEPMLRMLWRLGYRYLAAETFTDSVLVPGFRFPTFTSGVYLRDPVYASAVRTAVDLGYRLVPYEETARAPAGDASFRDRRQAENIHARVFANDPRAKIVVFAGRGHASEVMAPDGWTPMASVLKRITGIDPFTIFGVRMGERLTRDEEDPRYRYVTSRALVSEPTIFIDSITRRALGDDSFDAYVFWPRTRIVDGRPDWLEKVLGRKRVAIPSALRKGGEMSLVQAFRPGEPDSAIPVDQILIRNTSDTKVLMLPSGEYRLRAIDRSGTVLGETRISVK
jgi:hypothetical protein